MIGAYALGALLATAGGSAVLTGLFGLGFQEPATAWCLGIGLPLLAAGLLVMRRVYDRWP